MTDDSVTRTHDHRALVRAVVEMEINDVVAIQSVRLARRLKYLTEVLRAAHRRGRPSVEREARAMRFAKLAAEPPRKLKKA